MARAQAVWVVLRTRDGFQIYGVAGAFTVKHELRTWLSKQPRPELLRIFKTGDGVHQTMADVREYGHHEILGGK
jgi:hypothetical protein